MTTSKSRHPQGSDGPHTTSTVCEFDLRVLDDDAPMLHWALAYAEAGLQVLPLRAGTKRPLTNRGLHDATSDLDRIRHWWSQIRHANIGILCGERIDVADFDVRIRADCTVEYSSAETIARLNAHAALAGRIGVSRTRHGGLQILFPASGQRIRHAHGLHLDLLARGAYIVAPPSRVPADPGMAGPGRYSWIERPDFTRVGARPVNFNRWLRWLGAGEVLPTRDWSRRPQVKATSRALANFVARTQPGGRNNAAYWALCRALEAGVDVAPIVKAALSTGLPKVEVLGVLDSAQRSVRRSHV